MSLSRPLLLAILPLVFACKNKDDTADPWDIPSRWTVGEVVGTQGHGLLAKAAGPWGDDLLLVRVEGSQYDMGYQYGYLLGPYLLDIWWSYVGEIGEELGADDLEYADEMVGGLLDQIWLHFEPHTATEQLELMDGIAAGMGDAGMEYGSGDEDLPTFVHRMVGFAELAVSSQLDSTNIIGLSHLVSAGTSSELEDFYGVGAAARPVAPDPGPDPAAAGPFDEERVFNCSSYAAWGDRTEGGALFGTRNMDFSAGTGIYRYANVATFVPDDGIPFATVSWVGMTLGGLAGINRQGVSIGNAQSSTPMERLNTESALLRGTRVLQHATDIDSAMAVLQSAPTVGVAGVIGWGDPDGNGAAAEAAAFEMNGISLAVMRNHHDCAVDTTLYRYDFAGDLESEFTNVDNPELANLERDAQEIDGAGEVRYFACNEPCESQTDLVVDESGHYSEVAGPEQGMPLQTGYPSDCAVYRGDTALTNGVRMHQSASQGPLNGDGTGLMNYAGAFKERYRPFQEMTAAYAAGEAYEAWDETVIEDNGGEAIPVGLDEVEMMSRVTAMRSSNVWDLVFDSTNLIIRVSYESGTEESWVGAHDQPSFLEISLEDLFLVD